MPGYRQSIKVQTWVTAIGVLLLAIKFLAWWLTRSVAILTDALESIVNVTAGVITLYSLYVASRPRDRSHPYGHGKAEFISAGIEGTLITAAGIIILVESIRRLINPGELHSLGQGIWLIAATGLINGIAGWIALQTGKKHQSLGISATGKHLLSDALSTAGLVVGLIILLITGWQWVDSVVAIIFGAIITVTGYRIVRSSIAGIMDEADMDLLERMVKFLDKHRQENWVDLHNLRVIKYGNRLHLDAHLTLPWYLNLHEAHREVDSLSQLARSEFGDSLELFIHTDGCLPFSCRICGKSDCTERQFPQKQRMEWTTTNLLQNEKHRLARTSY